MPPATGAMTQPSPSLPRYGPRAPILVVGLRPGGLNRNLRAIGPEYRDGAPAATAPVKSGRGGALGGSGPHARDVSGLEDPETHERLEQLRHRGVQVEGLGERQD